MGCGLIYRLLKGEPSVLRLMESVDSPLIALGTFAP